MISELFNRLKTWVKTRVAAAKATCRAVYHMIWPTAGSLESALIVVSESGNVLAMGKRYRLTSGHAPLFSLYTYFESR